MDKIVAILSVQTEGHDAAAEAIGVTTEADREMMEQAKKTQAAIAAKNKEIVSTNETTKKSIVDLGNALNNVDKATLGAAYKKSLQDLRKELQLTNAQTKQFYQDVIKNGQLELVNPDNADQLDSIRALIQAATEELENFGSSTQRSAQTATGQFRAMRQELLEMEDAGSDFSEKYQMSFEELSVAAAKLQDDIGDMSTRIRAMASDSFAFDAMIEGLTGVAGAFSIAQGAAALFGSENEDLQKALLKVNAAMAILQGLQSLNNIIKDQSIAKTGAEVALRRINAASIQLETATQSQNIVVRYAAIAAQKSLNAVMSLSPAGILLISIGALATALLYFTSRTNDAAEAQKKFNASMDETLKLNDLFVNAIGRAGDKRVAELKKQNASAEQIRNAEIDTQKAQLEQTKKVLADKEQAYDNANETLRKIANREISVTKSDDKWIEELQKTKDNYEKLREQANDMDNKISISLINNDAETAKERLQNNTAFYEKRVAQAKAGTRAEMLAQIDQIRAKANEDINSSYKSEDQKKTIALQAAKDIAAKRKEIELYDLNTAKTIADDKVILAQEGSKEELNAKINQLNATKALEIANANGSKAAIKKINDDYRKQELQLTKDFNQKVAEDAINTRIAIANSQISQLEISGASATNEKLLKLKEDLIDDQARLEIVGIQNSEKNEELRRAKIQAVYDKALADKKKLERDKAQAEIDAQSSRSDSFYQQEQNKLSLLEDKISAYGPARKKLDDAYYENDLRQIENREISLKASLDRGLINQQDYNSKMAELSQARADADIKNTERTVKRRIALEEEAFNAIKEFGDTLFDNKKSNLQAEADRNQELYDKKIITQDEYNKRQKQLQREEAAINKQKAIFDIIIDGAKKIFEIQTIAATYAANPLTAALAPMALAQIPVILGEQGVALGLVAARKFKDGKVRIDGPGTETSDSIPAMLSKNETVINAAATKRYQPALEAINSMKFEEYLAGLNIPHLQNYDIKLPPASAIRTKNIQIDYDKLGAAVAKHVGNVNDIDMPNMEFTIDEDGVHAIMKRKNSVTEFQNKRYSTK
ncbi:hypothetical protein QTN47_17020 [Danxiaibacter flavus]|uniref:Phage tail tape measure protein n=1 Tax=Danxiaibacter flavus TaxID=3049108 RepID=A0ABV3ZH29_9BACT|nr:hypothetical protein QNM32_17030 [Chitinophagaceae bacterium DXS]